MKLVTKEMKKAIPGLGDQSDDGDLGGLVLYAKLFTPDSGWTWYIAEADFETGLCFGYVEGFEPEVGYFDLNELQALRGPLGLSVERDRFFVPVCFRDLVKVGGVK